MQSLVVMLYLMRTELLKVDLFWNINAFSEESHVQ